MSKMKELGMSLDEIIEAGDGLVTSLKEAIRNVEIILDAAKDIKAMFSAGPEIKAAAIPTKEPKVKPDAPVVAEPKKKTYTKEEVRKVLSEKSGNGYREQVKELLKKYGANNLSSINPDDYAAVVAEAEAFNG